MTDQEIIEELKTTSALNRARRQFSSWSGKIEQASQQRNTLSAIEIRRMEFEAVKNIIMEFNRVLDTYSKCF